MPQIQRPRFIEDALARKHEQQPQFDWLWRVDLPDISQVVDPTGQNVVQQYTSNLNLAEAQYFNGTVVSRYLSHRVYEFNTPYTEFDQRKSTEKASFRYGVDHSDIGSITMTMDEYEDGLTLRYLLAWQSLMDNPDGTRNPPVLYKKPVTFYRLSATKLTLHKSTYLGYFPNQISPMQNSQEGSGITQFQVTLTGDDVSHRFVDVSGEIDMAIEEISHASYQNKGFTLDSIDDVQKRRVLDRVISKI